MSKYNSYKGFLCSESNEEMNYYKEYKDYSHNNNSNDNYINDKEIKFPYNNQINNNYKEYNNNLNNNNYHCFSENKNNLKKFRAGSYNENFYYDFNYFQKRKNDKSKKDKSFNICGFLFLIFIFFSIFVNYFKNIVIIYFIFFIFLLICIYFLSKDLVIKDKKVKKEKNENIIGIYPFQGGTYKELLEMKHNLKNPEKYNVHHLISRASLKIMSKKVIPNKYNGFLTNDSFQGWGPSILMTEEDHQKTKSFVNNNSSLIEREEAYRYINYQTNRILNGFLKETLKEECRNIKDIFGKKYDIGIYQVLERFKDIFEKENNYIKIKNPDNPFYYALYKYK